MTCGSGIINARIKFYFFNSFFIINSILCYVFYGDFNPCLAEFIVKRTHACRHSRTCEVSKRFISIVIGWAERGGAGKLRQ